MEDTPRRLGTTYPSMKIKKEEFVTWRSPALGCNVLNTDGTARGSPGEAGRGVIIHNNSGTFMSAMALNFGRCTAFRAEVMSLLRALH